MLPFLTNSPYAWAAQGLLIVVGAVALALLVHAVLFWGLAKITAATEARWDDYLVLHLRSPSRLVAVALVGQFAKPLFQLPAGLQPLLDQSLAILFIVGVAWLLVRGTYLVRDILLLRVDILVSDNLRSRKLLTQVKILQNVVIAIVSLVGTAMVLMTFKEVRQVGVSLLASAGIAGIIIGFAAQKTIGNLLAGIQLAITQPIRLDDVVIIENEWGWIEEITLTYVVVKIWDLRRLVVPISYFIEKPFQNWTRSSSEILGTIVLHCDPSTSIDRLRTEADRVVRTTPLWDGKVCGVQVTECHADSIEVRVLVSALDSSKAWDLRCLVREAMLAFLQNSHPGYLPRRRLQMDAPIGL